MATEDAIESQIANKLIRCFKKGNKVLICGNGGSAAEASHFAGELMCKYKMERPALPAITLNDPAVVSAISNDYGYTFVFRRQIEALGKAGDLLITLTCSGLSPNILWAEEKARELGMTVIRFPTNKETGLDTAGSQELHLKMIHRISGAVEEGMFGK